jgi:hypothetical protein
MLLTKRDWLILIAIIALQALLFNIDTILPLAQRGFLLSPPKDYQQCIKAGGALSDAQQVCTFGILNFKK